MVAPIDFYFDFSSPYGYLASYRVDEIAAELGHAVASAPLSARCCLQGHRAEPAGLTADARYLCLARYGTDRAKSESAAGPP